MNADRQRIRIYKPPPNEAQGGDIELCLAAMLDAPPQSSLTLPGYLAHRGTFKALCCCYCAHIINAEDDAQRTSTRTYAHSACAWKINDEFFAGLDAMEAINAEKPALGTPAFF